MYFTKCGGKLLDGSNDIVKDEDFAMELFFKGAIIPRSPATERTGPKCTLVVASPDGGLHP